LAALEYRPHSGRLAVRFALQERNVCAADFKTWLRQLRRDIRRPIILVCDRSSVHRSAIKQLLQEGCRGLTVKWLPPYAPDLNPVEAIWNYAKYVDLANYVPDDRDDLWDQIAISINDQHFRYNLLRSFFHRAKLKL
jgi:transposase